ncbi:YnhF family membrane protein [Acinetobacter baumannii]|nr:hypothetical protein F905_02479 [Acinetobacter sp. CIP 53.82]
MHKNTLIETIFIILVSSIVAFIVSSIFIY